MVIIGFVMGATLGALLAIHKGYNITEIQFWNYILEGAIVGMIVGYIAGWALIYFGLISVASVGAGGAAEEINWLEDNANRAWHIVRPDHIWEQIVNFVQPNTPGNAVQNYQSSVLPILQRIVNNPVTTSIDPAYRGVGIKTLYEGLEAGRTVVVRVWESPTGQKLIEDAWVKN